MKEKIVFCWSGGKDSALALYRVLKDERYDVVALLTTCSQEHRRISMHGVSMQLLEEQARSIGVPLEIMLVPACASNDAYERAMDEKVRAFKAQGVTAMAFGDIFLQDLRAWREANLERAGLRAIFPIWGIPTREVIREFLDAGFGSIVCCVSDACLDASFAGRRIDAAFVESLPPDVDPCGENGEFHSFAFAGPVFKYPLNVQAGEVVYRPIASPPAGCAARGFWYCDLQLSPLLAGA